MCVKAKTTVKLKNGAEEKGDDDDGDVLLEEINHSHLKLLYMCVCVCVSVLINDRQQT